MTRAYTTMNCSIGIQKIWKIIFEKINFFCFFFGAIFLIESFLGNSNLGSVSFRFFWRIFECDDIIDQRVNP
jgi:hypothetical protein